MSETGSPRPPGNTEEAKRLQAAVGSAGAFTRRLFLSHEAAPKTNAGTSEASLSPQGGEASEARWRRKAEGPLTLQPPFDRYG